MRPSRTPIGWAFLTAAMLAGCSGESETDLPEVRIRYRTPPTTDLSCEIDSLYVCAHARGDRPLGLAELERQLPTGPRGVSPNALVAAADANGSRSSSDCYSPPSRRPAKPYYRRRRRRTAGSSGRPIDLRTAPAARRHGASSGEDSTAAGIVGRLMPHSTAVAVFGRPQREAPRPCGAGGGGRHPTGAVESPFALPPRRIARLRLRVLGHLGVTQGEDLLVGGFVRG